LPEVISDHHEWQAVFHHKIHAPRFRMSNLIHKIGAVT
jgi:hypothetical protein